MRGVLNALIGCQRGVTAIEYGLILGFVCIAVIASIGLVGGKTLALWTNVSTNVPVIQR